MLLRLAMQPFWVRALVYGASFGVLYGLFSLTDGLQTVPSAVVSTLFTSVVYGTVMAFAVRSVHTEMTEAVAGLDAGGRSKALAAVSDGVVPADAAVRNAAIRIGNAYLRQKTGAQLKREEWWIWLAMLFFVGIAIWLAAMSSSVCGAAVGVVVVLLGLIVFPLGVVHRRKIQCNVALLTQGADSTH
ncbi:hypothetical protein [Mycobacterium sp.]|uniref:hypothetical protein n=1 Tax=Mycobacterium sp. TaxID=1785 RepID=UPI003D0FFD92